MREVHLQRRHLQLWLYPIWVDIFTIGVWEPVNRLSLFVTVLFIFDFCCCYSIQDFNYRMMSTYKKRKSYRKTRTTRTSWETSLKHALKWARESGRISNRWCKCRKSSRGSELTSKSTTENRSRRVWRWARKKTCSRVNQPLSKPTISPVLWRALNSIRIWSSFWQFEPVRIRRAMMSRKSSYTMSLANYYDISILIWAVS